MLLEERRLDTQAFDQIGRIGRSLEGGAVARLPLLCLGELSDFPPNLLFHGRLFYNPTSQAVC